MLDKFTIDTFSEGDTLKVYCGDTEYITLEIIKVSKGRHEYPSYYREPFTLRLKGTQELFLHQDTYRVEHSTLGIFEVFIIPTMPSLEEKDSYIYLISFS